MTVLVTSDLHFTSHARDAYRWELFPWLIRQVKKTGAKQVLLLGDLTDAKDRHPAELVNRLVSSIDELSGHANVIILRGNHDYIDIETPFFGFLGLSGRVEFIREPTLTELDDGTAEKGRTSKLSLFLPNTRDYQKDWANINLKGVKYVFTHQTYTGAETENGTKLSGVPSDFFAGHKLQVWSGDIHVPQKVGSNIEYVGAPYRIHFGDAFSPRVVLLKHGVAVDLHFQTVSKELVVLKKIDRLKRYDFPEGTQVKVRMEMHRGDFPMWKEYKGFIVDYAAKSGWELYGPELVALPDERTPDDEAAEPTVGYLKPSQVVKVYARQNGLDKALTTVGLDLLKVV